MLLLWTRTRSYEKREPTRPPVAHCCCCFGLSCSWSRPLCPLCLTRPRVTCFCLCLPRSALHDRRFSPIEASELGSLDVSVSLLVKYEQARHWEDWEVRCVFTARGCYKANEIAARITLEAARAPANNHVPRRFCGFEVCGVSKGSGVGDNKHMVGGRLFLDFSPLCCRCCRGQGSCSDSYSSTVPDRKYLPKKRFCFPASKVSVGLSRRSRWVFMAS